MINVSFGINSKSVTLKDRIDISPVHLVLELKFTGQTDFVKVVQVTDVSSELCKNNEVNFELVEEDSEDLDNGQIYLIPGNYNYRFFQSDSPGLSTSGKLLESGILRFDEDIFSEKSFNSKDTEKTLL